MRCRRELTYTIGGWAKHRIVSHGASQLVARAPQFIVLRHTQISKLGQQPIQTIVQNTVRSPHNALNCSTSVKADAIIARPGSHTSAGDSAPNNALMRAEIWPKTRLRFGA